MSGHVKNFLEKRKTVIIKKWFDCVVDTYPPETASFLKKEKDPFNNPVGKTTVQCLEAIIDHLLDKRSEQDMISHLDPIIRIRSVQDFPPSKAAGFVLFLKKIIREELNNQKSKDVEINELSALDSKIDELVLIAFDVYAKCRETFYQIKANEAKNRFYKAFERAGLVTGLTEEKQDLS
ncbi:MAG: RsbRD N-terminal domain-containing protein [Deltaproteobacteria bacterium]|nr:RsbRD N-terminal domain-containing protein [Deltaproteobacteria bacterium]MBW2179712.1 RsbRD N-terminal domain-containing protein [Deltaproteobacteria bacterium]MBW2363872.1 RsbRD N-terminal domain-containing protein [Deltaproteobacteria bacterium]